MDASDLVQLFEKLRQVKDEDEFQELLGNVKKVLDGDIGLQKLRSDMVSIRGIQRASYLFKSKKKIFNSLRL